MGQLYTENDEIQMKANSNQTPATPQRSTIIGTHNISIEKETKTKKEKKQKRD